MTTKRKPYVRPMTSTWWKKLPFYRFYMLREGTAVPAPRTTARPARSGYRHGGSGCVVQH